MSGLLMVMLLAAGGDDKSKEAEALFQRARAFLKADQVAEACPLLEKSHALDPALGTLLNLADCEERTNHLVAAYMHFNDAAAWADRTHESQRVTIAQQRASALKPRLSWLALSTKWPVRGLTVKVNAFSVELGATAQSVPVDPGEALVTASARTFRKVSTRITVPPTTTVSFEVPKLVAEDEEALKQPSADAPTATAALEDEDGPPPPAPPLLKAEVPRAARTRGGPIALMISGALALGAGIGALSWSYDLYARVQRQQPGGPDYATPRVTMSQFQTLQWLMPTAWVFAVAGALALAGGSTWLVVPSGNGAAFTTKF